VINCTGSPKKQIPILNWKFKVERISQNSPPQKKFPKHSKTVNPKSFQSKCYLEKLGFSTTIVQNVPKCQESDIGAPLPEPETISGILV
jgi:hypothetical protein